MIRVWKNRIDHIVCFNFRFFVFFSSFIDCTFSPFKFLSIYTQQWFDQSCGDIVEDSEATKDDVLVTDSFLRFLDATSTQGLKDEGIYIYIAHFY